MNQRFLIDAHEDLSYESLYGKFDYTRSVADNRRFNQGPERFQSMIGWPELQQGQIGIVFSTIFFCPPDDPHESSVAGETWYRTRDEFHQAVLRHIHFYQDLTEKHPDLFRLVPTLESYRELSRLWEETPASYPDVTHPTGLIFLLEGAEGLRSFEDLDLYYEMGLRLIGPVWGGGRWCAGTRSHGADRLSDEGKQLLKKMNEKHYTLDISHMKNHSAMDALNEFDGTVIASHANCNELLKGIPVERHLNDETIRALAEHDGVMGVIPFSSFLDIECFMDEDCFDRNKVTLDTLANHIDHICQLTGSSTHAAIGTDADGGFGYPLIPKEMNDIHDIQKLADVLERRGYSSDDIQNIFHRNWQRMIERTLP